MVLIDNRLPFLEANFKLPVDLFSLMVQKKYLLTGFLLFQAFSKLIVSGLIDRISRSLPPLLFFTLNLFFDIFRSPGFKFTTSDTLNPQFAIRDIIALFLRLVIYLVFGTESNLLTWPGSRTTGSFFTLLFLILRTYYI